MERLSDIRIGTMLIALSTMFFEILAQELALRDMDSDAPTPENYDELRERMDVYLGEFEQHGTDNITVEM